MAHSYKCKCQISPLMTICLYGPLLKKLGSDLSTHDHKFVINNNRESCRMADIILCLSQSKGSSHINSSMSSKPKQNKSNFFFFLFIFNTIKVFQDNFVSDDRLKKKDDSLKYHLKYKYLKKSSKMLITEEDGANVLKGETIDPLLDLQIHFGDKEKKDNFLKAITNQTVMSKAETFLKEKKLITIPIKDVLDEIWFANGEGSTDYGFGHVFKGQENKDNKKFKGFHNWVYFFYEQNLFPIKAKPS
ncbi:unnamed protein product, partial [Meganyctiphanes norvegica]